MTQHGYPVALDELKNRESARQATPAGTTHHEPQTEPHDGLASGMEEHQKASPPSPSVNLQLPAWKRKLMVTTVVLVMAMLGYDASNLADIQVSIYHAFGHIELLPWVMASFSLANAAAAPLMRRLMEFSNLKWFCVASLSISAVSGIVSGASHNMQTMIAGRLLLGVGISGGYLSVVSLLRLTTTPTELARINGLVGAGFAIGLLLGPIIGASFAQNEHATWRWTSYIITPWMASIIGLICISFPSVPPRRTASLLQALAEIDWVGQLLHITSLVLFNAACLFSGTSWTWSSGSSIATWIVLVVVATTYALQQYLCWFTTTERRIFPVAILSTRVGLLSFVGTACAAATYGFVLYYSGLYFAFTRGYGAIQSAVHLLPYLCLYIVFALISGIFLPKIRVYAALYLLGGILITAGSAAMIVVDYQTSASTYMGLATLIGSGSGLTFQLGIAVLPVALPAEVARDFGILMNQAQYIPITMSLSIAGCIYQNVGFNRLTEAFEGTGFSSDDIRAALAGLESPILQGKNAEVTAQAVSILVDVIIDIFYMTVAAGALMIMVAFSMKWERLDFRVEAEKTEAKRP